MTIIKILTINLNNSAVICNYFLAEKEQKKKQSKKFIPKTIHVKSKIINFGCFISVTNKGFELLL